MRRAAHELAGEWRCSTVVHRDLYEEQLLVGDRIGLIDLDDAALGPPELDLGNLLGHVELLALRSGREPRRRRASALSEGYAAAGPALDAALLERCRRLTLLRLACLNDDVALAERALERGDPDVNPFLFMLGCPRSGTRMLGRLVDAHPRSPSSTRRASCPAGSCTGAG